MGELDLLLCALEDEAAREIAGGIARRAGATTGARVTQSFSRARTLMIDRTVHLPPRGDGRPRSLSAFAVPFALSPAKSDRISPSCCARAATLDRRHHLQLAETDVTCIGLPPSRSMVAEDIRDLQGRTSHDRRGL